MDVRADLHLHTLHSDGAYSPRQLLTKVSTAGISVISITDHDSIGALDEARAIGDELGVEIVPGVELSASYDSTEIHILGYFFDVTHPTLREALSIFREKRLKRAERIIDKLNKLNIPLSMQSVLDEAAGDSVGRPHIANAMVSQGHAESYHQAFRQYLGDGKPAYERKEGFSPEETIELIAEAGGLSFVAHPGDFLDESTLKRLIDAGLDGIEVTHPSHSPERTQYYRSIVNQYYLLESGGSDFHGGLKNDERALGAFTVPVSVVDTMRHRLF